MKHKHTLIILGGAVATLSVVAKPAHVNFESESASESAEAAAQENQIEPDMKKLHDQIKNEFSTVTEYNQQVTRDLVKRTY